MRDGEPAQLDDALDTLSSSWLLRRYPWAGSLSTAHTVLYYDRHGRDVFRRLASVVRGGVIGASAKVVPARFDLDRRRPGALPRSRGVAASGPRRAQGLAPGLRRRHRGLHVAARGARALPRARRRGPRRRPRRRARPPSPELAQRPRLTERQERAHVDQVVPRTHDHGAQEGGRVDAPRRPRHRGARRPRPAVQLQPDLRGAAPRGAEARAQAAQQIGPGRSGADAAAGCSTTTPSRACRASPSARRNRARSSASCPPVARCDPTAAAPTSRCA